MYYEYRGVWLPPKYNEENDEIKIDFFGKYKKFSWTTRNETACHMR
jgi:hypothetical protein